MADHHPDLIHVGIEHQCEVSPRVNAGNEISEYIYLGLVDQISDGFTNPVSSFVFKS